MVRLPELVSRRRALLGMAAVAPLSVVGGVGATVLLGDLHRGTVPETDHATMALAVHGRAVEPTPSLVVAHVVAGGSGRRQIGLVVRNDAGGRLSLAFGRARSATGPGPSDAGDWLDVTVRLDGDPVRSGPFDAVFDGTVERLDDRLCPGAESWLTVTWSASNRPNAAVREVATGHVRVEVGSDGCPGRQ